MCIWVMRMEPEIQLITDWMQTFGHKVKFGLVVGSMWRNIQLQWRPSIKRRVIRIQSNVHDEAWEMSTLISKSNGFPPSGNLCSQLQCHSLQSAVLSMESPHDVPLATAPGSSPGPGSSMLCSLGWVAALSQSPFLLRKTMRLDDRFKRRGRGKERKHLKTSQSKRSWRKTLKRKQLKTK